MNNRAELNSVLKSNFDVSVVMPFYKKLEEFQITLAKNAAFFQRNGIEIVIAMDEPSQKQALLVTIKNYPLINWKVIINEEPHTWRNPTKAINVGIKNASKKYILVMGPDSEMWTDILFIMRRMAECYENSFFVGRVSFVDYNFSPEPEAQKKIKFVYYGSIFAKKEHLLSVNGYDESFDKWGGDDDNIRARLQMLGLRKIRVSDAMLLHRESKEVLIKDRNQKHVNSTVKNLRQAFYPESKIVNQDGKWGSDFSKEIYNWEAGSFAEERCKAYLRSHTFLDYELNEEAFKKRYRIVALVPTYNEEKHMRALLRNLEKHCDGIIVLDDSSNDNTYNLASSEKILLKVKKRRLELNELENRNILLDLASFIPSEFFFYMDADERFDTRYGNLQALCDQELDTFCFYLVHLWESKDHYRTDIPEKSPIGIPGIVHRWRMFRNIGRMQISDQKIHVQATPYRKSYCTAPILILHYGMKDTEDRVRKYKLYSSEDERLNLKPHKYQYFLDEHVETAPISEIVIPETIAFT